MPPSNPIPEPPVIVVQIVHIEGPRKGEIEEFLQPVITIGRNPGSDVAMPRELRLVSRKHAEILRQGNNFFLVNHSPNGTFVNGKEATNCYIKQGDVIGFAEGGPKVSFLYSVKTPPKAKPAPAAAPSYRAEPPPRTAATTAPGSYAPKLHASPTATPTPASTPGATPTQPSAPSAPAATVTAAAAAAGRAVASYTIQYGTTIKAFKTPVVTLGTEEGCDFRIDHPRVFGVHAELSFQQGEYFLRDLTQSEQTLLNGEPLQALVQLQPDDIIGLGAGGAKLRYIGTGRFSEVLE